MNEINSCPFCGRKDTQLVFIGDTIPPMLYKVRCPWCEASGPTRRDKQQAIGLWNSIRVDYNNEDKDGELQNEN